MFNIGDKVKLIIHHSELSDFFLDKVYIVKEFDGRGNNTEWNYVEENGSLRVVNHKKIKHCFELIKENIVGKVNYHLLTDSVVINHNARTQVVRRGDARFQPIVDAIRDKKLELIPDLVDTELVFARKGITLQDGSVLLDGDMLPESLGKRLLQLIEEQMPVDILVKFWKNLKANPSFNSRKMLYQFLEHNGHPLTEDGCFIAYRGITEDFKDVHTKTMSNAIGSVVEIPRSEVDDNPNNTCSHGLHVACYDYAKGFGQKLVEVKVNPADVVTVPVDYNGTKMRVCKFEVLAECENIRTESVYSLNSEVQAAICEFCGEFNDTDEDMCLDCQADDREDW